MEFPVNVSEHPAAPTHFLFCARLLDIIPDDDGNFADTPHIDYALIEQDRLGMFLQVHGDLKLRSLNSWRQSTPGEKRQAWKSHCLCPTLGSCR